MKYIDKFETIELSRGKKYVVVYSFVEDGENFVYLINTENEKEQEFAIVSSENDSIRIDMLDKEAEENKEIISKISANMIDDMINYAKEKGMITNE